MKLLVWIGVAMMVFWGVLWFGIKMAIGAMHMLLIARLGAGLLGPVAEASCSRPLTPSFLPPSFRRAATRARAGSIYVSDAEPGIRRKRRGSRFHYLAPNGRPVTAARTLDRIRRLAIPPAYTDVWICREPRGHLQATGRDARQRKQYRYHAAVARDARQRQVRAHGRVRRAAAAAAPAPAAGSRAAGPAEEQGARGDRRGCSTRRCCASATKSTRARTSPMA